MVAVDERACWYPSAEDYYVESSSLDLPIRQGDVLVLPAGLPLPNGDSWLACQVVHPSCEIGAKLNPEKLQVIRVFALGSKLTAREQEEVVQGCSLKDGELRIAWANTFFLPPVGAIDFPMFSDFREVALVPRDVFTVEHRLAAMTHDARVFFIRRKLYWEQRWMTKLKDVQALEAQRISMDDAFVGMKPSWALPPS